MIVESQGNILEAEAEALVNTVNCVGIMGRGVAAQFKFAFPENFKAYKSACDRGEVQPGHMFVFPTNSLTTPSLIINFPTKRHWKGKSKMEDISAGLKDLQRVIQEEQIHSIAIPPLGCGLGGLNWSDVKPLIVDAMREFPEVTVFLYEPSASPAKTSKAMNPKIPNLTKSRALMISLVSGYQSAVLDPFITLLEVHKLLYLAQSAGQPLKLTFQKGIYGPYGVEIRHVLNATEGYFTAGYTGEADDPEMQISLVPGAIKEAKEFLESHSRELKVLKKVSELVDGWETPHGLELLTTVHWVVTEDHAKSVSEAITATHNWNERKKLFSERQIALAYQTLAEHGWITQEA